MATGRGGSRMHLAAFIELRVCTGSTSRCPRWLKELRNYSETDWSRLKSTLPAWDFDCQLCANVVSEQQLEAELTRVRDEYKKYKGLLFVFISGYGLTNNNALLTGQNKLIQVRKLIKKCFVTQCRDPRVTERAKLFVIQGCHSPTFSHVQYDAPEEELPRYTDVPNMSEIAIYWSHLPGDRDEPTQGTPMIRQMVGVLGQCSGRITVNALTQQTTDKISDQFPNLGDDHTPQYDSTLLDDEQIHRVQ